MVTVMALMLASVSSPADDRAFQILSKMAEALKPVERVELEVEFELPLLNATYKAQVKAQREPMRYWAKATGSDGSIEYASLEGKTLTYTDEGGNRVAEVMPSNRALTNGASTVGFIGWMVHLDRAWLESIDRDLVFYVQEESVDGQQCDLVAKRRTSSDGELITTITYFWVNKATNMPEAYQRHSFIRGSSSLGPKWRFKNVKVNPTQKTDSYPSVPEQVPVARRPAHFANEPAQSIAVGELCPNLEVETTEFKKTTLAAHFKGRTLLTFWAPWCGPCISEMKALKELPEVKDGRIRVVAVGSFDSKSAIQRYAKENLAPF